MSMKSKGYENLPKWIIEMLIDLAKKGKDIPIWVMKTIQDILEKKNK